VSRKCQVPENVKSHPHHFTFARFLQAYIAYGLLQCEAWLCIVLNAQLVKGEQDFKRNV